jgi:protein-S-isoprenylcysteine O-methyltransferase Ste14
MILVFLGLCIRAYAMAHLLGDASITIKKPIRILKYGPYRFIRHPAYLGSMLFFGGLFGMFFTVPQALVLSYLFLHFILDRIEREERLLIRHFGDEYLMYMSGTKKLIPFVW